MPLFFFISGYLFTIDRYKNFAEFACKKVKSILVPYLFLCIVSLILAFIVSGSETNPLEFVKQIVISKRNAMPVNPTLWFLTCLFAIELLFYLLTRALKNDLIKSGFIIVLSLLGFNVSLNATLPFSFNLSLYYLLFYLIGNLTKKVKDNHAVKYIGFFLSWHFNCFAHLSFLLRCSAIYVWNKRLLCFICIFCADCNDWHIGVYVFKPNPSTLAVSKRLGQNTY